MELPLVRSATTSFTTRLRFAGTVSVDSVPAEKRVFAYLRRTMEYVIGTVSNPDGTWEITGLPNSYAGNNFLIIAVDDSAAQNAECADFIQPVA
ncbi:MAG: hypothetical protein KZQ94_10470 [Candidatus Thiodiazotropha sp. (ex Troendleina suluensis)]|nr:hypothetical protein [Candidatus Thiodiazotropha sp. (ex Troendleina suluensis)]